MKSKKKSPRQDLDGFFHSIRFRLVLWFVLILAVVLAVFSSFVYIRQAQEIRSIAIGRLNYTLERLYGAAGEENHEHLPLDSTALTGVSPDGVRNLALQEGDVLAVQSADGSVMQSFGALTLEQLQQISLPPAGWDGVVQVSAPKIPPIDGTQYLFANPAIVQDDRITGYILLGVPLDANNQVGRLLISLVLGNMLMLAAALLGGFWIADRAMRPVKTITQAAQAISETDLNKRLHLPGKDELSELGNTFDAMLTRLQAAFERQRQFTADASHELRTPLTIIDVEASRILSSRRSPEDYESALHTIQSENQFMIRLVNNLLALARMDAGQVPLKFEPLDLSDLTLEVIERLGPLAADRKVALAPGDLPEVHVQGDRSTLIQMLTNLVENAIKYSAAADAPMVQVSTGSRQETGRRLAWVRVSDNGSGIATEHLPHLFDRFYRADASRSRSENGERASEEQASSGTGLGLAIALWIAHAHHGDIQVESEMGRGSTFEVQLMLEGA